MNQHHLTFIIARAPAKGKGGKKAVKKGTKAKISKKRHSHAHKHKHEGAHHHHD
jgi:hypothetical protein